MARYRGLRKPLSLESTFCGAHNPGDPARNDWQPGTQKLVTKLLSDPRVGEKPTLLLLDTIAESAVKPMPSVWVDRIRVLLQSGNPETRLRAVELARSRSIPDLYNPIAEIANDPAAPDTLRASALAALVAKNPKLAPAQYAFLKSRLAAGSDAILRQTAARVIARSSPPKEELLEIARKYLGEADPLVFSTLLECFRSSKDDEVGQAIMDALRRSASALSTYGDERLKALLSGYSERVQQLGKPLFAQLEVAQKARIEKLRSLEQVLTSGGDVGRGRRIFFGDKVACSSCHTIGIEGNNVGPDLTAIGAIRSGHDLLEAIVFPSASFVPGHEIFTVDTANDRLSGIVRSRGRDVVVLVTGPNGEVRIPRSEIRSINPSKTSLMPEGFDEVLTKTELADLLAFLQAEKTRPLQARASQ